MPLSEPDGSLSADEDKEASHGSKAGAERRDRKALIWASGSGRKPEAEPEVEAADEDDVEPAVVVLSKACA